MSDRTSEERWERKDAWLGLLFAFTGLLMAAFVVLSFWRGTVTSPVMYVAGGLLGLLFVVMGANSIVQGLRAGPGPRGDAEGPPDDPVASRP